MPKNFQTSQYDEPIAFEGYLDVEIDTDEGRKTFRVPIERAHMEEDTGKNSHVGGATGRIHGADYSLVDYNRAGIPLIEIVTKPITGTGKYAPEVAKAYVAAEAHLPFGGNGKSGNGSRQSGIWVLDVFTRWQSLNWDWSGKLQKAQMDNEEVPHNPDFKI